MTSSNLSIYAFWGIPVIVTPMIGLTYLILLEERREQLEGLFKLPGIRIPYLI